MAILTGTAGNDTLTGGSEADDLQSLDGDDTLIGGAVGAPAADTLAGAAGNDVYVIANTLDQIVELPGEGVDEVRTDLAAYTLGDNLETLTFTGSGAFLGAGNALDNRIAGGAGDDTLDGGLGADTLLGGLGDDTYVVDSAADVVVEQSGEGTDTVRTSLAGYTLGDALENLTFTGSGAFAGTGNALDSRLQGGGGNDTLDGGLGADTLIGGAGNDLFIIDDAADLVIENTGEGIDEVRTSLAAYALAANVEVLTYTGAGDFAGTGSAGTDTLRGGGGDDSLSGGAGNDSLDGGAGADSLDGGTGNDALNGGLGADTLVGGAGKDIYSVDDVGDVVIELTGDSTDTVRSAIDFTLGDNVEALVLTGTALVGTGNALNNSLTGTPSANALSGLDGDDTLTGGAGADTLDGGAGSDTASYAGSATGVAVDLAAGTGTGGDAAGDVVTELAGQGTDEVRTALPSYDLGTSVEVLTYTGSGSFAGTGNALDNRLAGADRDDSLSGGGGNDTLIGRLGADTLDGGTGTDTASYAAAGAGVVVDLATGTGMAGEAAGDVLVSIENLTGSAFADTLSGDGAANLLDGGSGDDSLSGGAGNDTLVGGPGADTLNGGTGIDTASYAASTAAVAVDLTADTGTMGDAAGDALVGIENLTGGAGNDTLRGDGGANRLDGGAGDDWLEGSGGNDTLVGGTGTDTALFAGSVRDHLATKTGSSWTIQALTGAEATDTLQGVEWAQFADARLRLDANNAPLLPGDLTAATDEDATPLTVDLLQGAWDFEGSALAVTGLIQTGGPAAAATLNGGQLSLDPARFGWLAAGQSAALTFAYGVSDGTDATARTLTVTVQGRNDAPVVAFPLTAATDEGAAPLVMNLLQGASDPDQGDTLSVTGFSQTGGQTVSVTRTGSTLMLDPHQFNDLGAGQSATLTFAYSVADGVASTPQTLTVTVQGRNDAPTAVGDQLETTLGVPVALAPSTLLANDHDPDGNDVLSIVAVGAAAHGTVSINDAGKIVFAPTLGYSGPASFEYTVADGAGGSSTARVNITVAAPPPSPTGVPTSLGVQAQQRVAGGLPGEFISVAVLADGSSVVAWTSNYVYAGADVIAQRYDAQGNAIGGRFTVNATTAYDQGRPSIAALADGGFVISWEGRLANLGPMEVFQQRFDGAGVRLGMEARVNSYTPGEQQYATTAALADGGWVVTWTSYDQVAGGVGEIYQQRYGAAGQAVGGEVRVNSYTAGDQTWATPAALADGGWVVVWQSQGQDGSGAGVYGQIYNADGSKRGAERLINQVVYADQYQPTVVGLADGGFVVGWGAAAVGSSGYAMYAQRFRADGSAVGGQFQVSEAPTGDTGRPQLAARPDGGFLALWNRPDDTTSSTSDYELSLRAFTANSSRLHTYVGTAGSDTLFGSSGADTLMGGAGSDHFVFGAGNLGADTITDFQSGQDLIEVVGTAFGNLPVGPLNTGRFALNAPTDADDCFVFNTATGILSYDPDGSGSMTATALAALNVRTLSANDIWVVASL